MRAYAALAGLVATLVLAGFAVAVALDVPLLGGETADLGGAGPGSAALSFGLLSADVVLPVPSSALMLANGALFGLLAGAAISVAASAVSAGLGWLIGYGGDAALRRVAGGPGAERAARLLARHGVVAIVLTRPVPVLAETVSVMAGAVGMRPGRAVGAAALGSVPPAVVYAAAGSAAAGSASLAVVFGGVVLLAALGLLTQAALSRRGRRPPRPPGSHPAGDPAGTASTGAPRSR